MMHAYSLDIRVIHLDLCPKWFAVNFLSRKHFQIKFAQQFKFAFARPDGAFARKFKSPLRRRTRYGFFRRHKHQRWCFLYTSPIAVPICFWHHSKLALGQSAEVEPNCPEAFCLDKVI